MKVRIPFYVIMVPLALVNTLVKADQITNSIKGINSVSALDINGNPLDGTGIYIGQVEPGRPASNAASDNLLVSQYISPFRVDDRAGVVSNALGDNSGPTPFHAERVAGVMISTDTRIVNGSGLTSPPTGVAIHAKLSSIAYSPTGVNDERDVALSSQKIVDASRDVNGDPQLRAINMSFGQPLESGEQFDGNSLLTLYVDWSAKNDNILYVVAGNENINSVPTAGVPNDNFNE